MLHTYHGHCEHIPLCQVPRKDILLPIHVQQLMTQEEINLVTETDGQDKSSKKRHQIFMQIFMTVCI